MKVRQTTEADADSLSALLDTVYQLPAKGVHVGNGQHVTMPDMWDGRGIAPPGWTRCYQDVWIADGADAWYPLPDQAVAEAATSRLLSGPQKAQIAFAAAERIAVLDLRQGSRSPKVHAEGAVEAEGTADGKEEAKPELAPVTETH